MLTLVGEVRRYRNERRCIISSCSSSSNSSSGGGGIRSGMTYEYRQGVKDQLAGLLLLLLDGVHEPPRYQVQPVATANLPCLFLAYHYHVQPRRNR